MRTITPFDTTRHHIYLEFLLTDGSGAAHICNGVLDTGAPWTEFNDAFLAHIGIIPAPSNLARRPGQETAKHTRIQVPSVEICGQRIEDLNAMVSSFDPSWGIAALVGLDFFRLFKVTIDYDEGEIACEPLATSAG